jgi:hypothetical protein
MVAIALMFFRGRRHLIGAITLIIAIVFGLLTYWSAQTIEDDDNGDGSGENPAATVPSLLATPGQ